MHVVDLTSLASDDPVNNGKFASADVVRSIGARLAAGQTLSDSKSNLGENLGSLAINTTRVIAAGVPVGPEKTVADLETAH